VSEWTSAPLGTVTRVVSGTTPRTDDPSSWGGSVVWVTPADLGRLTSNRIDDSARKLTATAVSKGRLERIPPGSVVMSSRAPIGHLAITDTEIVTNQGCKSFVPGPLIDGEFLYWTLRFRMDDIRSLGAGATFREVSKSTLASFEIVFPPLDEQRRIAARLRDQLAVTRDLDQTTETRSSGLGHLRSRVYEAAFAVVPLSTGPEAESPPGWSWHALGSLGRLESGHTPSRSRPDWWGGDIPWIALPDIRALDGTYAFETVEHTNPEGIAHSAARILPAGTVVLSRTASVGFVTIIGRPMATSQDFVNWVCGPDLDPEFLMHLFIRSRDRFRSFSAGAIHQTVYFPTAQALHVCVPPIEEQRRIAASLRDQLVHIDHAKAALRAQRAAVDALPAALLREVFGLASASPGG
jgi:type I restriction enzyme, S subunit